MAARRPTRCACSGFVWSFLEEANVVTEHATQRACDASARVLALMVAANGRIDARELDALGELGAFALLGV